jgi:hypothetical protein
MIDERVAPPSRECYPPFVVFLSRPNCQNAASYSRSTLLCRHGGEPHRSYGGLLAMARCS